MWIFFALAVGIQPLLVSCQETDEVTVVVTTDQELPNPLRRSSTVRDSGDVSCPSEIVVEFTFQGQLIKLNLPENTRIDLKKISLLFDTKNTASQKEQEQDIKRLINENPSCYYQSTEQLSSATATRHNGYEIVASFVTNNGTYALAPTTTPSQIVSSYSTKKVYSVHRIEYDGEIDKIVTPDDLRVKSENVVVPSPNHSRKKRSTKSLQYVMIWVIFDYEFFTREITATDASLDPTVRQQRAMSSLVNFAMTLINEVDLMYRAIDHPSLSFTIELSSIYITKEPSGSPYTDNQLVNGTVDPVGGVVAASDWITENRVNNPLDHAVFMTRHNLTDPTVGIAFVGPMCKRPDSSVSLNTFLEDVQTTARVVTHEIGHSLSLRHDVGECLDFYIMSPYIAPVDNNNTRLFSNCSILQLETFIEELDNNSANCFYEEEFPYEIAFVKNEYASLSADCESYTGQTGSTFYPEFSSPCFVYCTNVTAPDYVSGYRINRAVCGDSAVCSRGECIYDSTSFTSLSVDQQCQNFIADGGAFYSGGHWGLSRVCDLLYCTKSDGQLEYLNVFNNEYTSCGNKSWCINHKCVYDEFAPAVGECQYGDMNVILDGSELISCAAYVTRYPDSCSESSTVPEYCCATCNFHLALATDECTIGNHTCHEKANCSNTVIGFDCTCMDGYVGDGFNCTDADLCLNNTANCTFEGVNCTNIGGALNCTCDAGFNGNGFSCSNINECQLETDDCSRDASCLDTQGSFNCTCLDGFTGDGLNCTDINECQMGTDNCSTDANCTNTHGSYNCICQEGYAGDGFNCTNINECDIGTDDCSSNAICLDTIGSYTCTCNHGFSGDGFSCTDIDECMMGTDNCSANANCTNTEGDYNCICDEGYSGDGFNCTDINECILGTDNCSTNANCTNTIGNYTCACNSGFSGDGFECQDIDECVLETDNCSSNANCTNTVGTYTCTCHVGYTGDGFTCSDVNECLSNTDECSTDARCTNAVGGYNCTCLTGFTGNGFTCSDVDECRLGTDNCSTDANCNNIDGGFNCACKNGYTGDGFTCSDINECLTGSPCSTNANCTNNVGSFNCLCIPGYTGNGVSSCSNIDECQAGISGCSANGFCLDTVGSYTCTCLAAYVGDGFNCTVPAENRVDVQATFEPSECDNQAWLNNLDNTLEGVHNNLVNIESCRNGSSIVTYTVFKSRTSPFTDQERSDTTAQLAAAVEGGSLTVGGVSIPLVGNPIILQTDSNGAPLEVPITGVCSYHVVLDLCNGRGNCEADSNNNPICRCNRPWKGTYCDELDEETAGDTNNSLIIGGAAAGAVILLSLFIFAYFIISRCRTKQNTSHKMDRFREKYHSTKRRDHSYPTAYGHHLTAGYQAYSAPLTYGNNRYSSIQPVSLVYNDPRVGQSTKRRSKGPQPRYMYAL